MKLTSDVSVAARPLTISDVDREPLSVYLTRHEEQRVGRYFERLLVYWVRYIRRCEIVAQSLQLRDGKRTMGEIDLLFRDEQGRLTHWEVACKFYLQVDVGAVAATDYIGPNANDTLRRKATRLREHQLPIGARNFPEIEVQEAVVKGRIFYHWHSGLKESPPVELASGHLDGKWIRAREVPAFLRANRLRYRVLRKPFWLAEEFADPTDDDLLMSKEAAQVLETHFRSRGTPILISGFPQGPSPVRESERCFVVPDHWPEQAGHESNSGTTA